MFDTLNKQKITFLVSTLGGGGAEGVCVSLANKFAELNIETELVVLTLENEVYLHRLSSKVKIVNLQTKKASKSIPLLKNYVKQSSSRIYIVFNYELSVILNIINLFKRNRIVIISRNINTISKFFLSRNQSLKLKALFLMIKHLYTRSDFFINQSRGMEEDFLSFFPYLAKKSCVINNPVNSNYKYDVSYNSIQRDNYILCVGRLEHQKAFHRAVIAFSYIAKKVDYLNLRIVGDGSLKSELIALVDSLNLTERVEFVPFTKNLKNHYLKAQLTLLTSLFEGFPNVLVESISLGTPVVSINCESGPSEIITEENGILVEDEDKIAISCLDLINKNIPREKVVKTSIKYDIDLITEQYLSIIQGL